eukprot:gene8182-1439_t
MSDSRVTARTDGTTVQGDVAPSAADQIDDILESYTFNCHPEMRVKFSHRLKSCRIGLCLAKPWEHNPRTRITVKPEGEDNRVSKSKQPAPANTRRAAEQGQNPGRPQPKLETTQAPGPTGTKINPGPPRNQDNNPGRAEGQDNNPGPIETVDPNLGAPCKQEQQPGPARTGTTTPAPQPKDGQTTPGPRRNSDNNPGPPPKQDINPGPPAATGQPTPAPALKQDHHPWAPSRKQDKNPARVEQTGQQPCPPANRTN